MTIEPKQQPSLEHMALNVKSEKPKAVVLVVYDADRPTAEDPEIARVIRALDLAGFSVEPWFCDDAEMGARAELLIEEAQRQAYRGVIAVVLYGAAASHLHGWLDERNYYRIMHEALDLWKNRRIDSGWSPLRCAGLAVLVQRLCAGERRATMVRREIFAFILAAPPSDRDDEDDQQEREPDKAAEDFPVALEDPADFLPELIQIVFQHLNIERDLKNRLPDGQVLAPPSRYGQIGLNEAVYNKTHYEECLNAEFIRHLAPAPPVAGDDMRATWERYASAEFFEPLCEEFIPPRLRVKTADGVGYGARLLATLQLCRRLTTSHFEGNSFECLLLLARRSVLDRRLMEEGLILQELVSIRSNNLLALSTELIEYAEIAQAPSTFLFVDLYSARLEGVYSVTLASDADVGRALRMHNAGPDLFGANRVIATARLAKNGLVAIHMREGKFVEVYGAGRLALWHDGFQWRSDPLGALRALFDECLVLENIDIKEEIHEALLGTVAALMDRKKSSILVFLDMHSDGSQMAQILRPMRPSAALPSGGLKWETLKNLPRNATVALLQLDGAHVFDKRTGLIAIAQQIASDEPGRTPTWPGTAERPGAGTRSAKSLSETLPSAYIVKVSASGSLKIFHDRKPWQPRGRAGRPKKSDAIVVGSGAPC